MAWTRKAYTTPGADPTTVVEWTNGRIKVSEFQGTYKFHIAGLCNGGSYTADILAEELHKALEAKFDMEQEIEWCPEADDMSTETFRE